jgi:hypothetical protein
MADTVQSDHGGQWCPLPFVGVQTMSDQSVNKMTKTDTIDKSNQPPATKPVEGELSEQELEKVSGGSGGGTGKVTKSINWGDG